MPENFEPRDNDLLRNLPENEYVALEPLLEPIDAEIRLQVYEPDSQIDYAYFPVTAVFSLVALVEGEVAVEVETIGREGFVGLPIFLGADRSPNAAFCQVAGTATRIATDDLENYLRRDGALHHYLHRFTQATIVMLAQGVACNRLHTTEERLARWLLTTRDRLECNEFDLTHEFLGQMLGVRRATVSLTAGVLQSAGLIRYSRGTVAITDPEGLHASACECYDIVRNEHQRLLEPR